MSYLDGFVESHLQQKRAQNPWPHGPDEHLLYLSEDDARSLEESAKAMHALLVQASDLVPRIREDEPMTPALAEWMRAVCKLLKTLGD